MKLQFLIEVDTDPDFTQPSVGIAAQHGTDQGTRLKAMVVACEHLINLVCMESAMNYEESLKSLCEGARSCNVKEFHGVKSQ